MARSCSSRSIVWAGSRFERTAGRIIERIDFNEALMHEMLGALLFAGALHIRLAELRGQLARVIALAVVGTVISTFLTAGLFRRRWYRDLHDGARCRLCRRRRDGGGPRLPLRPRSAAQATFSLETVDRGEIAILTWGGLRGGISVALALSLPVDDGRPLIVATTYVVVVFSILVQGLTLGRFARRYTPATAKELEL